MSAEQTPALRLPSRQTWIRLMTDTLDDSRVQSIHKRLGAVAVVGWLRLLLQACRTGAQFTDIAAVGFAIEHTGYAIDTQTAHRIAWALLEARLIVEDGESLTIADWSTYEQPRSTISPNARRVIESHAPVRSPSDRSQTSSDGRLIEGGREGEREGEDVERATIANEYTTKTRPQRVGGVLSTMAAKLRAGEPVESVAAQVLGVADVDELQS
jgi:hypothetical protein